MYCSNNYLHQYKVTTLISGSGLEQSYVQWFSLGVDLPPEGLFQGIRGGAVLPGSNYSNPDPKSDYKIVIFNVLSGISKQIFFGPLGLIWFTN